MKISQAFPSKYLRAADLDGREPIVEINKVEMESINADEDDKPVIYFAGKEKGVVLNKTNAAVLSGVYGDDTAEWKGELVKLFTARVDYQGKTVDAIRMKIPTRAEERDFREKRKEPELPETRAPKSGGDDEIPF